MAERLKWTPEMIDRLHDLRARNWTVLEIAQDMGIPFKSVQGRINREKLKKLPAQILPEPVVETTAPPPTEELLTKAEAASVADFIDFYLFDAIRKDSETDNMFWLVGIIHAFDKLCAYSGYKIGTGAPEEDETDA